MGIWVDPLNTEEIKDAIIKLCNPNMYLELLQEQQTYLHSYQQIANEILYEI
jgi:hypothetical protein